MTNWLADAEMREIEAAAAEVGFGLIADDYDNPLGPTPEDERQARIRFGLEMACRVCGCSYTKPCPGGCIWAAPHLCSRCARRAA